MIRHLDVPLHSGSGPQAIRMQLVRAAVSLLLVWLAGSLSAAAQPAPEGNPFRGRELFQQKNCSGCHSVWGHGGALGPEITVAVAAISPTV